MSPSALLRRLWRAQLRLRVLAGVVLVTLAALAAFDVAAVTIMRGYLIGQTDQDLKVALALTRPQLPVLLPGYPAGADGKVNAVRNVKGGQVPVASARSMHVEASSRSGAPKPPSVLHSVLGEFDITYVPAKGKQVTLQVGETGPVGAKQTVPAIVPVEVAGQGPQLVTPSHDAARVRVASLPVTGGQLIAATSLNAVDATMNQVVLIVAIGSAIVVALIGAGVFLVLRRGLRPIESMAAQADRITAGDLTERVTPHSPRSEVGRLGAALNGMLARIESGVREREASQEQTRRFFADASHELRTPLASLRANAELYLQGALTCQDQVDEVMGRIVAGTRRMGRLVDDMLRLARLGQHPARCREAVDVTGLVNECADRVRSASPGRAWRVTVAPGLRTVGDEELLCRAVDNLLTNVLTHTSQDAAGTIIASGDLETITIEVADDGPGVTADKLPRIFERFYRADARQDRPGSGLGLAIAAEVAAAHGGTAHASPVTPHGLRITLTLPSDNQDCPEEPGLPPAWFTGRGG